MATIRRRSWTTPKGEAKSAWVVDYRDTGGERRSKQFVRKKDADAWLTQAAWEVSKGVHTPDSKSITIAEAADLWIAKAINSGKERGTVRGYKELAKLHIGPLLGSERLSRLSMPKVEAFKDALLETRSAAMTSKAVRALSSILTEAMRRGLVAQNVARGVKVTRSGRDKKRIVIPERDESRALLKAAEELTRAPEMRPLMITAIFAGLRSSELRGLRWSDIDLKGGTISVNQRADAWGVIGAPKSEAGFRTIPI
jgi:integrase